MRASGVGCGWPRRARSERTEPSVEGPRCVTTTFDRYLVVRYLHVFAILFVSVFGLYVVIDGFTNIDEFLKGSPPPLQALASIASFYAIKSSGFFDMIGPILAVIAAMIVFALLMRNSELQPVLAAGVPTRRLLVPVIAGTLLVNVLLAINQELLIPQIAYKLQASAGDVERDKLKVEPVTDHSTGIYIDGREISLESHRIRQSEFVLPAPRIVRGTTRLLADEAVYYPRDKAPAPGWLLKNVATRYADLPLTEEGRSKVLEMREPRDLFVVSEVSLDQLHNRMQSYRLLSTLELIRRIWSPTFGQGAVPGLILDLHARLLRPLANVIVVLVAVPLVLRKESYGLVTNMAVCMAVLTGLLAFSFAATYFGKLGAFSAPLAAWLPILCSGTLAAWLSDSMQT
jgi:lipopolysaccharide export system permease protein